MAKIRHKIIRTSTVATSLETFCKDMLRELSKSYEVVAVSSDDDDLRLIEQREGVRVVPVNMKRHISPLSDFKSLYTLYRLFRKERPEMVHSITPKAGLLSMIAAWLARVPIRVHTFTGLVFPTAKGLTKKILITTDKITCACATNIYPEGNGVKRDLEKYKITKKPLKVLGYGNVRGIDLDYYNRTPDVIETAKTVRDDRFFTFVFVGRIVRDKGMNELLSSFDRLSMTKTNVRLILVGREEPELDPISEKSGKILSTNEYILAVGEQPDVRPWLASADALVFPSYREGFPNVVIEAGAMGVPSIVTDINGSNEIIIDGENGEIIAPKDEDALYNTMQKWCENPALVKRMATNCRKMVAERYDRKIVWSALFDEYSKLLK